MPLEMDETSTKAKQILEKLKIKHVLNEHFAEKVY
jgi:hypothetical protein